MEDEGKKEIESEKKVSFIDKLSFKQKFFIISCIIYLCLYSIFVHHSFLGIFYISVFSNEAITYLIIIILTFFISRHVIRLKLVLYRIFLQTFLDTESKIYKFFSHGYFVRIIAVIASLGLSLKLVTFLTLLNVHQHQFFILCIGITIYIYMNLNEYKTKGYTFIRGDVNSIIKSYLAPFLIACTTGLFTSLFEILTIDINPQIINMHEIINIAVHSVENEHMGSRLFRIIARHIYAYELIVDQLIHIPFIGKSIYILHAILSEGALTFFSIFLILMPYKKEEK